MSMPMVVIVGRPNVGKSSLLNSLARQRISIVDPRAGITRDRVSALVEFEEKYFELIDTGGIGIIDNDQLEADVEEQISFAMDRADLILFVVDVTDGLTPPDQAIAARLRKLDKPMLLLANKADALKHDAYAGVFEQLGFGPPMCVSALHNRGREELLTEIIRRLGERAADAPTEPVMKLAIVGKRNAGKSTLVNALAGEERMIVSEVPGTTRDAVDVRFEKDGRQFVAIDTAGVRKKRSMTDIDFYSHTRALSSIRRADVVMMLIDATVAVSEVDLKLAAAIGEEYKPVLLAVNKWDLARGKAAAEEYGNYLAQVMPMLSYAPIAFMTAKTGKNVGAAVDAAINLFKQATTRVSTGRLNKAMETLLALRAPTAGHGARPVKIFYATQISTAPPTIVFFCNDPTLVSENYRRFMENRLREMLPFKEVPIRLYFRSRHESPAP